MSVLPKLFYRQSKPNRNPRKLFYGFQKTHPKVYMEKQKIQNSQHNIKEEQSWRSGTTILRLTTKPHSQDTVVLKKNKQIDQ